VYLHSIHHTRIRGPVTLSSPPVPQLADSPCRGHAARSHVWLSRLEGAGIGERLATDATWVLLSPLAAGCRWSGSALLRGFLSIRFGMEGPPVRYAPVLLTAHCRGRAMGTTPVVLSLTYMERRIKGECRLITGFCALKILKILALGNQIIEFQQCKILKV
jgi:hypothetical protein